MLFIQRIVVFLVRFIFFSRLSFQVSKLMQISERLFKQNFCATFFPKLSKTCMYVLKYSEEIFLFKDGRCITWRYEMCFSPILIRLLGSTSFSQLSSN